MTAPAITPTTADEMHDVLVGLSDPATRTRVEESGGLRGLVARYTEQIQSRDPSIQQQVREELQASMRDFLSTNGFHPAATNGSGAPRMRGFGGQVPVGDGFPVGSYQAQKQCLYNKAAPGAALDGKMDSTANFLRAVACEQGGRRFLDRDALIEQLAKLSEIQNSFSTNVPSDGGFLIPEEFRSDLMLVALENAIVRPRATVIPMSTQTLAIPAVDDTTHSGGTVFGGVQTYWVDESTAPTESSGKFQQVKLDAKKLMAYLTCPQELVADAPAFNAYLNQVLPKAIAFEEDYRFLQGNGAGQPLGVLHANNAGLVTASAVSGQGANTIIVDNLAAMYARLLPSSMMNAIWIASIDTFPQLALMAVTGALGNSTPVWMNNGVIGAPPAAIYGRPVYFTEKAPALGSAGDLLLIDPSFYLIGDRQVVTTSMSEHFLFSSDKLAYKVIERVDGRPWLQSPITPRNAGNTISAYVVLSGTRT
jgi:HK97 family phage major capsid protein